MKYISLAFHNNEMVVVGDMSIFATHFCYSKKQRQGAVDNYVPLAVSDDEAERQVVSLETIEDADMADEDDI